MRWRNTNGNSDGHIHAYSHADIDRDGDSDGHSNCYGYSDADTDTDSNGPAEAYPDAEAASDASASSVACRTIGTVKAGTRDRNSRVPRLTGALLSQGRFIFFHALRSRRGDRSTFAH